MPLYAYRCASCGHAQDHLQRMSDPLLTVCPNCGQPTYEKQVTAAGFQLKGSGWYVTDFRDGAKPADKSGVAVPPPSGEAKSDAKPDAAAAPAPAAGTPAAPAAAPASAAAPAPAPSSSPPPAASK